MNPPTRDSSEPTGAELHHAIADGRLSEVEDQVAAHLDATRSEGDTLLEAAASILKDPGARYAAIRRLVELGIDVPTASRGRSGVLNVLIGAKHQDPGGLVPTIELLLAKGADAGVVSQQGRTPTMELVNSRLTDAELEPFLDDWFARDDLNLRVLNPAGVDALTLAERRNRAGIAERIKTWLEAHPDAN